MSNYVKGERNGRPESPHQAQPKVNPQRAMHAANLKVPMRPEVARPGTAQTSQGLHGRGESVAQHQPAFMQQQRLQGRPSSESQKRDQYDTDAESIDTTVNHSVIQVENTQQLDQQFHPDNEDYDSGGSGEGQGSGEADLEDVEFDITDPEVQHYLVSHSRGNASYNEQIRFLRRTQPEAFRTVDGDSYPTTTEGNPTEVDEQQEQPLEHPDPPSPSPQSVAGQGRPPSLFNQQHHRSHHALDTQQINSVPQQTSKLYQQGAQIRGQQRLGGTAYGQGPSIQEHGNIDPPTSQPPSYSQTTREQGLAAPSTAHARHDVLAPDPQSGLPQRFSRMPPVQGHVQNPVPKFAEPTTAPKRAPVTRPKAIPIIQMFAEPAPVEPSPVEQHEEHVGDYDPNVLPNMRYEELRDESFDKDPREQEPVLPKDMREKPLDERLQFAQQELDPTGQAYFFSALPTTEWEEAGEWFLDQFSKIITRTREARQKKRKEAQRIEEVIGNRHQHVAKRQRLLEGAMAKMQAQGESLVPKSPRASKSPRSRRG